MGLYIKGTVPYSLNYFIRFSKGIDKELSKCKTLFKDKAILQTIL